MTTETTSINGYEVTLVSFGADKRLFITNPEGVQIYGHKTSGINYLETAKREIADDMRLAKVGVIEPETIQEISVEGETVAAQTVTAYCGCECDRENKVTVSYCEGHETKLYYWQAIYNDAVRAR